MSRFAAIAREHWRAHLPNAYADLSDPDSFFDDLGAEALDQVVNLEEHLRGVDPEGETFIDRMSRFERARQQAEEIVIRDLLLQPPQESQ